MEEYSDEKIILKKLLKIINNQSTILLSYHLILEEYIEKHISNF